MFLSSKFFRFAFGVSGTRAAVPDAANPSGYISYEAGYPADYALPSSNPSRKPVERDKVNQLYYDITSAVKQYQADGIPEWISAADNGGVAKSYKRGARVLYTGDGGSTWDVYESLSKSNTAEPSKDPTKWALYVRTTGLPAAGVTGTANAIQAAFYPPFASWDDVDGVLIRCLANTSSTVTINIDGLGAKTVYKGNNLPLEVGDIAGGQFYAFFKYDTISDEVQLLNPAANIAALTKVAHIRDEKPSGTDGGTFTSGSWQTRTLNTFAYNNISGASLAANQITLPAGTYRIKAKCVNCGASAIKTALYNVTDSAIEHVGLNAFHDAVTVGVYTLYENSTQDMECIITIAGTKAFTIVQRSTASMPTTGFGRAASISGISEIYADVFIEKL